MHSLCSDYIAVRMLYGLEPLTTAMTILPKMLDVVEKALKLHLAVQTQTETALSDARSEYGHNLEKLRAACAQYEKAFDHPDIQALTKDLNDKDGKLYQHMRYGSQETTTGWQTNLALLLPVVDRVFANALLLLPEQHRRLLLFCSSLKSLVTRSRFDQSRNPDHLTELLARENYFFGEFIAVFETLDRENEQLSAQLQAAASGQAES